MCIWEIAEEKRLCAYCSYRGGCESFPKYEKSAKDLFDRYYIVMNMIVDDDIKRRTREHDVVWGRYIVIDKMYEDGIRPRIIGELLGIDRVTTIHAKNQIKQMREYPSMYRKELKMYIKFIEKIQEYDEKN